VEVERLEQGEGHPFPGPMERFEELHVHVFLRSARRSIDISPSLILRPSP
jgi:hypothetical protein